MARHPHSDQRNWRDDAGPDPRWRDENEALDYDYRYTRDDEGDSSVRAGSYDQGRIHYGTRPDAIDSDRNAPSRPRAPGHGPDSARADERANYRDLRLGPSLGPGRQGGYGGNFGEGRYGDGGSLGRFDEYARGGDDAARGASPGPHRGKGPKGYERSDERLRELICERLREDPEIDASNVVVTVAAGRVTLDGAVESRRVKYLVEDVAEQLGVDDVQNNLRVGSPRGTSAETRDESMTKRD